MTMPRSVRPRPPATERADDGREVEAPPVAGDAGAPAQVVEASVHTGRTVTRYFRSGSGAPVLLLLLADEYIGGDSLLAALARSFRVIRPDAPRNLPRAAAELDGARDAAPAAEIDSASDNSPAVGDWLRSVIDTLGIERVHLVVDHGFSADAIAFALTDTARVGRLAILAHGPPDSVVPDRSLGGALLAPESNGRFRHELLIVRREPGRAATTGGDDWRPLLAFLGAVEVGRDR